MRKHYLTTAAILLAVPAAYATADNTPVVVVKTANGPVRIPASEFNDKQHELHTADEHHDEHGVPRNRAGNVPGGPQMNAAPIAVQANGTPVAPVASIAPNAAPKPVYGVLQNKGRFYVVDGSNGTPISGVTGIDPKGYGSNADAWGAITAVNLPPSV